MKKLSNSLRSALIIAHPGHELFVYGWVKNLKSICCVLTDGSGRLSEGRAAVSKKNLEGMGCALTSLFGRFSDLDFYDHIVHQRMGIFQSLVDEIAEILVKEKIEVVIGDSYERQYLSHDVCRLLIGAAIELVYRQTGQVIETFEFPMYGYHGDSLPEHYKCPEKRILSEEEFSEKLAFAQAHPDECLQEEIKSFLKDRGLDSFREEEIFEVSKNYGFQDTDSSSPTYEVHGQRLVSEGKYPEAIGLESHVRPLANMLWSYVTKEIPKESSAINTVYA